MCRLESNVEGKCSLCWFNVDVVEVAEGKVQVKCRRVAIVSGGINCQA